MSWTDDLAIEKRRRESLEERKANFLQWASLRTPSMTERLIGQLRTDTENVVRSLGIWSRHTLTVQSFRLRWQLPDVLSSDRCPCARANGF